MALETYLDSNGQLAVPLAAPSHGAEELLESLSSSILVQKDGLSKTVVASHLVSPFENLSTSIVRAAHLNVTLVSGDVNSTVLNNSTNSGPSVGSLVTDANSPLPGGAHLQGSGSTSMEPCLNLPSSPMSFSSNNISTPAVVGSSITKQISHLDQSCGQGRKRQQPGSIVTSQPTSQTHQVSQSSGTKQEPSTLTRMCKKPRPDINQEDFLQLQIMQQVLQRQGSMQLQDHNPQLQPLIRQHALRNQLQREILHSVPQVRGLDVQQPQQQMRHQWQQQQQTTQHVSARHSPDGGICSRRLMQHLYHLRHRPHDNNITYWRKFVAEYYAPCAKKRWCLSLYENIGQHSLGVFSQAAMEAWHCDICGSKSGKGFEAIFEILPRLSKIKFESGVLDELLFLDLPQEHRFPSGLMVLEYRKAVQETVYEQFHVVREGQLRIIFGHDLKILSWEFCARRHEELLLRRLVAPQVNHLVQAAHKYQSTINDNGSDGVPRQDLRSNCNMLVTAGRQFARNLELLMVNDLGFSKRYVRCLQIAEVVNNMKDLMTFSRDKNIGPIESLKTHPREDAIKNIKMKEMEQQGSAQSLLTGRNKLMAVHAGSGSNMSNDSHMIDDGTFSGSGDVASALTNYYQKLLRQNSSNSAVRTVKQEQPYSVESYSRSALSSAFLSPQSSSPGQLQGSPPVSDFSSSLPSQGSKNLQQCMINELLQEMVTKSRAKGVKNADGRVKEEAFCEFGGGTVGGLPTMARGMGMIGSGPGFGNNTSIAAAQANVLGSADSLKATSSSSQRAYRNNTSIKREPDLLEFKTSEAVRDMAHQFLETGVLNVDRKDMGCRWKV